MQQPPEPPVRRHADHDPSLICRPAFGYGLCEVLELAPGLEPAAVPPAEPETSLPRPEEEGDALW
jgi:hypothetical protein